LAFSPAAQSALTIDVIRFLLAQAAYIDEADRDLVRDYFEAVFEVAATINESDDLRDADTFQSTREMGPTFPATLHRLQQLLVRITTLRQELDARVQLVLEAEDFS
jgi:hypothetical protein